MPPPEVIQRIREEHFAEDIALDLAAAQHWTEAQLHDYFERGGKPAVVSRGEWLKAFDEPAAAESPPSCACEVDDDDDDDDLGGREPCAPQRTGSGSSSIPTQQATAPPPPPPKARKPSEYENTAPASGESSSSSSSSSSSTFLPGVHKDGSETKGEKEPLPQLPRVYLNTGVMTVDEACTFLGVTEAERGDLDKLKTRFRKMCLRWHPDKNRGREKQAAEVFQAVNAAYHFLTTNNFDHKRWAESFVVPPLQSLEDVLLMALTGEDPFKVEEMLRQRGEFRPHRDFGVNLSIPW